MIGVCRVAVLPPGSARAVKEGYGKLGFHGIARILEHRSK